ncbi:hypothetical protein [Geopsychrobacter electrodiphilus]|uniref:hypothetical protein n=1 Tax=Geopsychrobacter electrodiphilus TaxID=225196 RepID=UPI0003747DF2|nr:hypothetical protein [Geopsychrobacter electrodiphilus]
MSKLQIFLEKALRENSKNNSSHLGDRSKYVGASDIAGCPRKAVMSKFQPEDFDAKTLLRFSRGHAAEDLIDGIFRAGGLTPQREVELFHPDYPEIKCHIDFLFNSKTSGRYHVMELKTTNGLPDAPYESWVNQLHVQMGLLELDKPGVPIGGSILAVDLNAGEWKEFNSFTPNRILFDAMIMKGRHILFSLNSPENAQIEPGILCGYCSQRGTCPAFAGDEIEIPQEIRNLVARYLEKSEGKRSLDKEIKGLKNEILSFTGTNFKGHADLLQICASEVGPSEAVDSKRLKEAFPEVYDQVKKERAGFTRLDVARIRKQAAA